jgi:hypothetical protein
MFSTSPRPMIPASSSQSNRIARSRELLADERRRPIHITDPGQVDGADEGRLARHSLAADRKRFQLDAQSLEVGSRARARRGAERKLERLPEPTLCSQKFVRDCNTELFSELPEGRAGEVERAREELALRFGGSRLTIHHHVANR